MFKRKKLRQPLAGFDAKLGQMEGMAEVLPARPVKRH